MLFMIVQLLAAIAVGAIFFGCICLFLGAVVNALAAPLRERSSITPDPIPTPQRRKEDRAFDSPAVFPWEYATREVPSDEVKSERTKAYRDADLHVFRGFYAVVFTEEHGAYLSRNVSRVTRDDRPYHTTINVTITFPEVLKDTVVRRCLIFNEKGEYMSEVERYQRKAQPMIAHDVLHVIHTLTL